MKHPYRSSADVSGSKVCQVRAGKHRMICPVGISATREMSVWHVKMSQMHLCIIRVGMLRGGGGMIKQGLHG